jgi:thioredoxin-like negative regulator of GroEL
MPEDDVMMETYESRQRQTAIPNREELIRMAIRAAKTGNRNPARVMFMQVLNEDKHNERAMMWMAKLASTKEERKQWLHRVLSVNPANENARIALANMNYKRHARENTTLITFGIIAAMMMVIGVLVVFVVLPSL